MCILHLEDEAYERVTAFGTGKGRVVLDDPVERIHRDLFNDDFVDLDASDCLLRQQTQKLSFILNDLCKNDQIDRNECRWLLPNQPYSGSLPRFYALPKVHKLGTLQIRPIVSCCGNYSDKVMIRMKEILNFLLWGGTSIANSYDFVKVLENFQFSKNDQLLSYDVSSLFTRVPVNQTLQIVESRLAEMSLLENNPIRTVTSMSNSAIMHLLQYSLDDCYFSWEKGLYKQRSGLPMGGRLSPILANIFMESLEYTVLCTALNIPKLFCRYVDDIFLIWDKEKGNHLQFLQLLNDQHLAINLTHEEEVDRQIPFLDLLVQRPAFSVEETVTKLFLLNIYRKPTNSNRYLQYNSSHDWHLKKNLVKGLWLQANRLLKNFPDQLKRELQFLLDSLSHPNNGYPQSTLRKWFFEFERNLHQNPDLLNVRSHLVFDQMFDMDGQQIFKKPTAESRFPVVPSEENDSADLELVPELQIEDSEDPIPADRDEHQPIVGPALRRNRLIIPFVPRISEKLKHIAGRFGISTWFTYSGRISDHFTVHRGRIPRSQTRHAVYSCQCSCDQQYIGESFQNLKV